MIPTTRWEPAEHILDAALLADFEERQAKVQPKPEAGGKARKVKVATFLRD